MAKFILNIKENGRRYDFNLYSTHLYDDDTYSEDARLIYTDNLEEFMRDLLKVICKEAQE